VVLDSGSIILALAVREFLREPDLGLDIDNAIWRYARLRYVLVPVGYDEGLISRPASLPSDWNADPPPLSAAAVGDAWVLSGTSAVLEVPSAVIHSETTT